MTSEFADKTALITGGTTGIGRAVAMEFARRGAHVIAAGLPDSGGSVPEKLLPNVATRHLDVASDEQISQLIAPLESLDILVNCAGIIGRDDEFEMRTFLRVLDVNLSGTMRMCLASHKLLAVGRGSIVNMSSMLAYFGGPRVPAYSASKGGISQLTRSLAVAWSPEGIRVNAVAPGWIATPLTRALQDDPQRSEPILSRTPMKRWGKPEEIAAVVIFLCSQAASFITGAIIPVDGGYSAA